MLKVVHSWTVAAVGGNAGLFIAARNFIYLFTPGRTEGNDFSDGLIIFRSAARASISRI